MDQEVANGAFATAEDYVSALIEADQKRKAQDHFPQDLDDIRTEGLARIRSRQKGG